jgi:hypothetical protein
MAKRQFVLMNAKPAPANLGSIAEFREAIARYNDYCTIFVYVYGPNEVSGEI